MSSMRRAREACPTRRTSLAGPTLLLFWLAGALSLSPAAATTTPAAEAPRLHDGDLLNTSDAWGPGPQRFSLRCGLASSDSRSRGTWRTTSLRGEYGLWDNLALGFSTAFYNQTKSYDGAPSLAKQGIGDSRITLRWRLPRDPRQPLQFGLRPALRIPTGYDQDADSLAPFTSGTLDFELLATLTLHSRHADLYLTPGVALPGEEKHSELLGGCGVRVRPGLPLGLQLAAEFFTRYDLPLRTYRHEAYAGLAAPLAFDCALEVGLHQELLDGGDREPALGVRLGYGVLPREADRRAAPRLAPTRLGCAPFTSRVPDPHGFAAEARRQLLGLMIAATAVDLQPEACSAGPCVELEVISLTAGRARGLSIPKLLATPQATLEAHARVAVCDAGAGVCLGERHLHVLVRRGLGAHILPTEGDEDTRVPTAQIRSRLRRTAAERLAADAWDAVAEILTEARGK